MGGERHGYEIRPPHQPHLIAPYQAAKIVCCEPLLLPRYIRVSRIAKKALPEIADADTSAAEFGVLTRGAARRGFPQGDSSHIQDRIPGLALRRTLEEERLR